MAWILNAHWNLNISHFYIDLNSDKFKSKLTSRLYYDDIYSDSYFSEYEKLSRFRNIMQHRHIIRVMRIVTDWNKKNRILIPKDPETFISNALKLEKSTSTNQYVKIFDDVNSVIRYGLHEYFNTLQGRRS